MKSFKKLLILIATCFTLVGCAKRNSSSSQTSSEQESSSVSQSSSKVSESPASSSVSSEASTTSSKIQSSSSSSSSSAASSSSQSSASSSQSVSPNAKIALTDPNDTSNLTSNCKQYVEDIRNQEKSFADKYKAVMDKDNVKIESYLDKSTVKAEKSDRSTGVNLKFNAVNGYALSSPKIKYGMKQDLSDAVTIDANANGTLIKNLYAGTTYYWKVVDGNVESDVSSFKTGDYPRWIDCAELFNVRDMGGYMTSSGKRVKQGLIYRGGEITRKEWGTDHAFTGTEAAKAIFRNVMKIGCEVDFRNNSQSMTNQGGDWGEHCGFAENDDIKYYRYTLNSFTNSVNNSGDRAYVKSTFERFAEADERPVYFHCHGGADRTGTIGFFLLAMLGVSYTDTIIDYELTSYSSIKGGDCLRRHYQKGNYNDWPGMMSALRNLKINNQNVWNDNNSLKDNMVNFLTKACNISTTTITKIQTIMLED